MKNNLITYPTPSPFNVGDKVWFWYSDGVLVRCTIREVVIGNGDPNPEKMNGSFYFYWLDEPIGHGVGGDEICLSFEEATENMSLSFTEVYNSPVELEEYRASLEAIRLRKMKFIAGTHDNYEESFNYLTTLYEDKIFGEAWFDMAWFEQNWFGETHHEFPV